MTYYTYMTEMQQFCFRITQAAIVLKDKAMQDFYSAAEEGFNIHANQLPISEANSNIGQNQIDAYLRTKKFCEKKEEAAAYKLKEQADQFKPVEGKGPETSYEEWEEMLSDNQIAEEQLEALNGCN